MIKLKNLDKFFNKKKANEIHVINNVSLELPEKGLVTLLGASGSGKTTLLNVIGGLDSAHGTIDFDGQVMEKYKSSDWDQIRAKDVGFIFQNYHLLEDITVYANIKLVLNQIDIIDEAEVKHRVNYVLNAVGMFRFRNKLASDLSGGQKQRVAIARAIVKNPKLIIADEPTGNIDSKNSLEVLNIIKKLSKEKLVVLVTHEKELAYRYSDRIIEIVDGIVVSDEVNQNTEGSVYLVDDRNIYLGDLEKELDTNELSYFKNDDEEISLQIIKIGSAVYINPISKNVNVRVLDSKSEIRVFDGKKALTESDSMETTFSVEELESVKGGYEKQKSHSFGSGLKDAFVKLFSLGKKGKFQLITLIFLGMYLAVGIHFFFSIVRIDESTIFLDENKYELSSEYYQEGFSDEEKNEMFSFEYFKSKVANVDDYYFYNNADHYSFPHKISLLNGNVPYNIKMKGFELAPVNIIGDTILVGNLPKSPYEIVVSASVFDRKNPLASSFANLGIKTKEELIGRSIQIDEIDGKFKVVGIANQKSSKQNYIYFDEPFFESLNNCNYFFTPQGLYYPINDAYKDIQYNIVKGRAPIARTDLTAPIEVLVSRNQSDTYLLNQTYEFEYYFERSQELKVVGYTFDITPAANSAIRMTRADLKQMNYFLYGQELSVVIHVLNENAKEVVADLYDNTKVSVRNNFEYQVFEFSLLMVPFLVMITIYLGLSLLLFYFFSRTSLTSRVKEISVLRAIGMKKSRIVNRHATELLVLTVFTSLIGFILGSFLTNSIFSGVFYDFIRIDVSFLSVFCGVIIVIGSNLLIGLLPVWRLLTKNPAELLTYYDM